MVLEPRFINININIDIDLVLVLVLALVLVPTLSTHQYHQLPSPAPPPTPPTQHLPLPQLSSGDRQLLVGGWFLSLFVSAKRIGFRPRRLTNKMGIDVDA